MEVKGVLTSKESFTVHGFIALMKFITYREFLCSCNIKKSLYVSFVLKRHTKGREKNIKLENLCWGKRASQKKLLLKWMLKCHQKK